MAVEVDFFEFTADCGQRVPFLDDLAVAGGVVGVGKVVVEALGEAALRDELGKAVAVRVVGDVDRFAAGHGSANELVVEAVNVRDGGRASGDTLSRIPVRVIRVAGETVIRCERLGLARQDAGEGAVAAAAAGLAVPYGIIRVG